MLEPDISKTKKNKNRSLANKQNLWKAFDENINNKSKIECVYRVSGEREYCDDCCCKLSFNEDGFLTCTNSKCAIVYTNILDSSPEWRFYGADDSHNSDPTRCGIPINPLLKESSYGCKVIPMGGSSYEMRKIKRYTDWQAMPYKEKSQYEEFQKITMMAQNNGISKLFIDSAIRYHKKISEYKTFRGMNRDGIIAASLYISFRINGCPRTPKEIATIFNLDHTHSTKGCKNAMSIINTLEKDLDKNEKTQYGTTNPLAFIERYCSRLNINSELTKLAQFIAKIIENKNLIPENTPPSIAAGIIYFICQICKLNISKGDVNNISEISEVTINKCYKKLDNIKFELIPPVLVKKYGIQ